MDINSQNNADYTAAALAKQAASGTVSPDKVTEVSKGIQSVPGNLPDAQRKAGLSGVQNPNLPPKASTEAAFDPEVAAKLEQIEQLLNSSSNSNAARILGRLMVELGALQRKEALTDRLLARDAAQSELKAGAKKLDQAADATMAGAVTALVAGVVSGIVSIGFSMNSLSTLGKAGVGETAAQTASAKVNSLNAMGGGISGMTNAVGQSGNSMAQSVAQGLQADQAREQANAEVTKSEGEMEATEQQALQEFLNQMIQFIKELRDAEVEQLAVVTRG